MQQLVSLDLKVISEHDRTELEEQHKQLAYIYSQTLDNLRRICKELWADLYKTHDMRTKSSFYHELQEINLKIIELASTNDIVLATVRNTERIAKEAKTNLEKIKEQQQQQKQNQMN